MQTRLLRAGKLMELLSDVLMVVDPAEGQYMLYAPRGAISLEADMECAIILMLHEDEDDFSPDYAVKHNLAPACDVRTMQNVIEVALEENPETTSNDWIQALNYYLDNDAFMDFPGNERHD